MFIAVSTSPFANAENWCADFNMRLVKPFLKIAEAFDLSELKVLCELEKTGKNLSEAQALSYFEPKRKEEAAKKQASFRMRLIRVMGMKEGQKFPDDHCEVKVYKKFTPTQFAIDEYQNAKDHVPYLKPLVTETELQTLQTTSLGKGFVRIHMQESDSETNKYFKTSYYLNVCGINYPSFDFANTVGTQYDEYILPYSLTDQAHMGLDLFKHSENSPQVENLKGTEKPSVHFAK